MTTPTNLTPSPVNATLRESIHDCLQNLLYALVTLASDCGQAGLMALGAGNGALRSECSSADAELSFAGRNIARHMVSLGLDVDITIAGSAGNNPFDAALSAAERSGATLGAELLTRFRKTEEIAAAVLETVRECDAMASAAEVENAMLVSARAGGQIALALV